jgi:hypothetical protein
MANTDGAPGIATSSVASFEIVRFTPPSYSDKVSNL